MKSTGYIINGVYHKGTPDMDQMADTRAVTDKQYNHDKQRQEHRADMVQPWTREGKPNPEFVNLYPEESKGYGFIKED